ncbi:hypothetical protein NLX67_04160 [Domibacillus sp. A3M-37]|uniref:hypothetical protein n=1 Tax=Domibacillus sp. A3M-37 TaxID=2962037 RepID=UPI0020B72969|nr:hypothetical protein [Domibacillus sp. A3M-37]MCP3761580.1 hypothetical protein [Domibacillus sp. A3M-37]
MKTGLSAYTNQAYKKLHSIYPELHTEKMDSEHAYVNRRLDQNCPEKTVDHQAVENGCLIGMID